MINVIVLVLVILQAQLNYITVSFYFGVWCAMLFNYILSYTIYYVCVVFHVVV